MRHKDAQCVIARPQAQIADNATPNLCCRVIAWLQEKGSIAFARMQDMQQKVTLAELPYALQPSSVSTALVPHSPVLKGQAHRS